MRILLTGGSGMLGQTLLDIATRDYPWAQIFAPARSELPLTDGAAVAAFIRDNGIDTVIHGAAKVGGIQANIADPIGFLSENLAINQAVIMGAYENGVERFVYLGSSCMYPRDYTQPLREDYVLAAPLEPTNEGYALSKITGARLCDYISAQSGKAYRTLIPCNLFGARDHFGSTASHLVAAIVTKVAEAQEAGLETVEIWGSGQARREFLLVDDLADYILRSLQNLETLPQMMNTGYGSDHSVLEYYQMVAELMGYSGRFTHDLSKPEGMMAKLMDSTLAASHGWGPVTDINTALTKTIDAYRARRATAA